MSLFPKSEWTDWAKEWGMEHLPQKGRLFRDESIVGIREGRLVQVGWGGQYKASLIVLIRFPRVEAISRFRDALIADSALDTLPGKGAKRRSMTISAKPVPKRRPMPEFTLDENSLRWVRPFPSSSPKSANVRRWVETLLGAIGRSTEPFGGRCERCNAANVRGFVLVDSIPMILCASCQQRLRAEGEMAERSYDLQQANHAAGATLALLVAVGGAIAWAILETLTGKIHAAVAIVTGLVVARAYRHGAGRVDASGRLIGAIFTLGSVALGDLLAITFALCRSHAAGVAFARAVTFYESVAVTSPRKLAGPLLFGLFGALASSRALQRPKLQSEIRQAGESLQYGRDATRNS